MPDTAAIVAIQQLLHRYGHLVDAADWDAFETLFVAEATLDYTPVHAPQVFHGIAEIRSYFETANHPAAHHVTNVYVYEAGGGVRVKSKFIAPFARESNVPHRWYGGDYDDIVVETPAGWCFAHRTCTPRWELSHHDHR